MTEVKQLSKHMFSGVDIFFPDRSRALCLQCATPDVLVSIPPCTGRMLHLEGLWVTASSRHDAEVNLRRQRESSGGPLSSHRHRIRAASQHTPGWMRTCTPSVLGRSHRSQSRAISKTQCVRVRATRKSPCRALDASTWLSCLLQLLHGLHGSGRLRKIWTDASSNPQ